MTTTQPLVYGEGRIATPEWRLAVFSEDFVLKPEIREVTPEPDRKSYPKAELWELLKQQYPGYAVRVFYSNGQSRWITVPS